jgi:predicted house-cleaning noncanonical NTP pyrophosphatase (MazG superfamily)
VRRNKVSAEQIRFKPKFLQETHTGEWKLVNIARTNARHRSLALPDLREVAVQTHRISERINKSIQIMWFCAIPEEVNVGRNVPWFMMDPEQRPHTQRRPIAPGGRRILIRTIDDLDAASLRPKGRHVLSLDPESELFRNDEFLNSVASVALEKNFPVLMSGSILGHAYYTLERKGVSVITDTSGRSRVRQRQIFGKLVRDEIPAKIAEHGERANLAQIAKPESRTALVVKLFEEAQELLRASSPSEITMELADLLEVVRALAGATGVSWEEVQGVAEEKRQSRGSFARNVVLMETSWPRWNEPQEHKQQRVISLKDLACITASEEQYLLNFPSVIAKNADNLVSFDNGNVKLLVSIVDGGVQVKRADALDSPDPLQLEFSFPQAVV